MTLAIFGVAFLQGLLGSPHCVGMCGPFVHALGSRPTGRVRANVAYHVGRVTSYIVFGVLLGLAGGQVNAVLTGNAAAIVGGVLILYFGLSYLFPALIPRPELLRLPARLTLFVGRLLRPNSSESGSTSAVAPGLALGAVSGILPCGLLYPAYAMALGLGSPLAGAGAMLAFGLGTVPALSAFSFGSAQLYQKLNAGRARVVMGVFLVLFGAGAILMRVLVPHHHDHEYDHQTTPADSAGEGLSGHEHHEHHVHP